MEPIVRGGGEGANAGGEGAPRGRRGPSAGGDGAASAGVALLPCGHEFHERCICGWLRRRTCPLCRREVSAEEVTALCGDQSRLVLEDGLTTIEAYAFQDRASTSVTLPASLAAIRKQAVRNQPADVGDAPRRPRPSRRPCVRRKLADVGGAAGQRGPPSGMRRSSTRRVPAGVGDAARQPHIHRRFADNQLTWWRCPPASPPSIVPTS